MSKMMRMYAFSDDLLEGQEEVVAPASEKSNTVVPRTPIKQRWLDKEVGDRLYQAWLQAYTTNQVISEIVTVTSVSANRTLLVVVSEALQDAFLRRRLSEQINVDDIPFLARSFSIPLECQSMNEENTQVNVVFNGDNCEFQNISEALLQSIDLLIGIRKKVAGLSEGTKNLVINQWISSVQNSDLSSFNGIVSRFFRDFQIHDTVFAWEEVAKDVITLIEYLNSPQKRFIYLSEDDRQAEEILDSLCNGTRDVSSLSYDEMLVFSKLISVFYRTQEVINGRVIDRSTEGIKQFFGITEECPKDVGILLAIIRNFGIGSNFCEWKVTDLREKGSSDPEADYRAWLSNSMVWDFSKDPLQMEFTEIAEKIKEIEEDYDASACYNFVLEIHNAGQESGNPDSISCYHILLMTKIMLTALEHVGIDAEASIVFSSLRVTPIISFHYELLDIARRFYYDDQHKDSLERLIKGWKMRRLLKNGSTDPEQGYLDWVKNGSVSIKRYQPSLMPLKHKIFNSLTKVSQEDIEKIIKAREEAYNEQKDITIFVSIYGDSNADPKKKFRLLQYRFMKKYLDAEISQLLSERQISVLRQCCLIGAKVRHVVKKGCTVFELTFQGNTPQFRGLCEAGIAVKKAINETVLIIQSCRDVKQIDRVQEDWAIEKIKETQKKYESEEFSQIYNTFDRIFMNSDINRISEEVYDLCEAFWWLSGPAKVAN